MTRLLSFRFRNWSSICLSRRDSKDDTGGRSLVVSRSILWKSENHGFGDQKNGCS